VSYSDIYSDIYGPAFPQSQLDLRTELLLGGVWTDISKLVYQRAGTTITYGHADESSQLQPSTAPMQLNNRSGNLSPRNPYGQWFGLLGRNTPLRLSTPAASSYLRLENDAVSYATCPDRSTLDITGDIDVRVEMRPTNWASAALASKATVLTNQESWLFLMKSTGQLEFAWSPDGTIGSTKLVVSTVAIPVGRIAVRATLTASTGTVTFYTAPSLSGSWTQLGAPASGTLGAPTTIFSSSAPVQLGYNVNGGTSGFQGQIFGFQLRSSIGGTLVASPDFTAQLAGTTSFSDAQGNLWTMAGTSEVSNRRYRIHAEVPAWPPRWDNTGQDQYVPVEPAGLTRRLTQGTPPAQSALYRAYATLSGSLAPLGGLLAPVAYWPCEDGSGATSLASALPGGSPMAVTGTPSLASGSGFVCSQAVPVLAGSSWRGQVATGLSWPANTFRFLMQVPAAGDTNGAILARMYTGGTVARVDVVYNSGASGSLTVNCYNYVGTLTGTANLSGFTLPSGGSGGCNSWPMRIGVDLQPSGGNVVVTLSGFIAGASGLVSIPVTVSSATIGAVTSVLINPGGALTQTAVGHITIQRIWDSPFDLAAALNANFGETAGARFVRLCTEEGIASRIVGSPDDTVPMGYQPPLAFVPLLQQCEDADRGLLFEPKQVLGYGYRTRASMCNQAAAVALDYALSQPSMPFEPTDDDQYTVNDAVVTRSSGTVTGSSARQYTGSGPESVLSPPSGVGDYGNAYSLNLATDGQAAQEAGWIVHVGSVDEPRYPAITVDLTRPANASLVNAAQDAEVGDRVTVANTPTQLPPDGVSQLIRGGTEALNGFQLTETWVCVPESPYRVGVYDDATFGHYDTDGSSLFSPVTAAAVTLKVATLNAGSPLWTTNAADFPFDIEASPAGTSGERMTVTNITGASSPQTFTVTRAVNGVSRSWPAGTDIRLFQPAVYSL
jgi:hypothetical protein